MQLYHTSESAMKWRLTPLRNYQHCLGNVVVHIWRILHTADERPIVTHHRALDSDGSITLGNVPNPGYPVFELPHCCWVGNRLIMKNLKEVEDNNCCIRTLYKETKLLFVL